MNSHSSSNPVASLVTVLILIIVGGVVISFIDRTLPGIPLLPIYISFVLLVFILSGFKVIDQFERGVVLTLGKYSGMRDPGLTWIFPAIQRLIKVDLRIITATIPQQEAITKDNVPVGINAVVYFRVDSAEKAILEIENFQRAVKEYAQGALRDVIGGIELDSVLAEREKIADEIKKIVDESTKAWGINVTDIKIQDIELPADMKRVMAKQAESERERRSVIIKAEGEYTAAERLSQAAERLASVPGGIALRTLSTIEKINPDPSKTVIFALPVEFMEGVKSLGEYLKNKSQ